MRCITSLCFFIVTLLIANLSFAVGVSNPISPNSGQILSSGNPCFSWGAASGASYYTLQVGESPSLTDPSKPRWVVKDLRGRSVCWGGAFAPNGAAGYTPSSLPAGKTYYWRVKAMNGPTGSQTQTSFSSPQSFIVNLAPPTLQAPANGVEISGSNPYFSWSKPSGTLYSNLQVSPYPDMITAKWLLKDISGSGASWNNGAGFESLGTNPQPVNLIPGETYYWRVRVFNGTTASYTATNISGVRSFVMPHLPPGPVHSATVAPSVSDNGHFTISWSHADHASGALIYHVDKYEDGVWINDIRVSGDLTQEFIRNRNDNYLFRVKACNSNTGLCSASQQITATVQALPNAQPVPFNVAISDTQSQSGLFSIAWSHQNHSSNNMEYHIYQRIDGVWGDAPIRVSTSTSESFTRSNAANYHFRVRACLSGGVECSLYSASVGIVVTTENSAPNQVLSISATPSFNGGNFVVSWEHPDPSQRDLEYRLFERFDGVWNSAPVEITTNDRVVVNRVESGEYVYRVQVCRQNPCSLLGPLQATFVTVDTDYAPKVPSLSVHQLEGDLSTPFDGESDYRISLNAPETVLSHHVYELYEKSSLDDDWPHEPIALRSIEDDDAPPFFKEFTEKKIGSYRYRARVCVSGLEVCTKFSEVLTVYVENRNDSESRVIFIHTDLLGSPASETDESGDILN